MFYGEIVIKQNKATGVLYFFNKEHPLSDKKGMVYFHRHVLSKFLGRWLKSHEVVHHVDGNKTNNEISNLQLVSAREHGRIHNPSTIKELSCPTCGRVFMPKTIGVQYCSGECTPQRKKKFEASKERLEKLVWEKPLYQVALEFNVESKAIIKRCKRLGIIRPPAKYWQKKAAVKI